jgi:hypothetical protein
MARMFHAFHLHEGIGSTAFLGWSGVKVRLIHPTANSAANDNRTGILSLIGGAYSLRAELRSLGSALPLLALALVAWWAATLERDQHSAFERIAARLTDMRLLGAGPIAIADCGAKGCADPSDTVYRFAAAGSSCFTAAGAHLVGEPGEDDLGTGMLVADERGRQSLLLLDEDLRSVAAVATVGVASRPCPQRRRPSPGTSPRV